MEGKKQYNLQDEIAKRQKILDEIRKDKESKIKDQTETKDDKKNEKQTEIDINTRKEADKDSKKTGSISKVTEKFSLSILNTLEGSKDTENIPNESDIIPESLIEAINRINENEKILEDFLKTKIKEILKKNEIDNLWNIFIDISTPFFTCKKYVSFRTNEELRLLYDEISDLSTKINNTIFFIDSIQEGKIFGVYSTKKDIDQIKELSIKGWLIRVKSLKKIITKIKDFIDLYEIWVKDNQPNAFDELTIKSSKNIYDTGENILKNIEVSAKDLPSERKYSVTEKAKISMYQHDLGTPLSDINRFIDSFINKFNDSNKFPYLKELFDKFMYNYKSLKNIRDLLLKSDISSIDHIIKESNILLESTEILLSFIMETPDISKIYSTWIPQTISKDFLYSILYDRIKIKDTEENDESKDIVISRLRKKYEDVGIELEPNYLSLIYIKIYEFFKDYINIEKNEEKIIRYISALFVFHVYLGFIRKTIKQEKDQKRLVDIELNIFAPLKDIKRKSFALSEKEKNIIFEVDNNAPQKVLLNEDPVIMTIYNFIKNAFVSGFGDEIKVKYSASNNSLIFSVSDYNKDGTSISLIELGSKIFDEGVSTTGSGVGLYKLSLIIENDLKGGIYFKQFDSKDRVIQTGYLNGDNNTEFDCNADKYDIKKTVFYLEFPYK